MKKTQLRIKKIDHKFLTSYKQVDLYTIILIDKGNGTYQVETGTYNYKGPSILFMTPYQNLQLKLDGPALMLQFHGDFYCIEYHKEEVACNGLLFNNIFLAPHINLPEKDADQIEKLLLQMKQELESKTRYDKSVITAYLQLILALCSRLKKNEIQDHNAPEFRDEKMEKLKVLIEENYLTLHRPRDYASLLHLDSNQLTKRCKKYFGKSPSSLIHERIILEARKLLHLTRRNIKDIAFDLQFKDEHYFSRFFKKSTGLSPQNFRKKTGISVVADLSTRKD